MRDEAYAWPFVEFVKHARRLITWEPNTSECICSEFTIAKKKCFCFSVYRPRSTGNIDIFFNKMAEAINKVLSKYENFIIMGDFNIDIKILN